MGARLRRTPAAIVKATGTRGLVALATPNGLSQVLATLLENSLIHGAGTVTVSTRSTGISLVVEVTDEGPGVPPELGARIFERVGQRPAQAPGWAWPWPASSPRPTAAGSSWCSRSRAMFALFLSAAGAGPR